MRNKPSYFFFFLISIHLSSFICKTLHSNKYFQAKSTWIVTFVRVRIPFHWKLHPFNELHQGGDFECIATPYNRTECAFAWFICRIEAFKWIVLSSNTQTPTHQLKCWIWHVNVIAEDRTAKCRFFFLFIFFCNRLKNWKWSLCHQ